MHHCKTPTKGQMGKAFKSGAMWTCPQKTCRKQWFLRPAMQSVPILIWKDA